jgi:hypothetical protein
MTELITLPNVKEQQGLPSSRLLGIGNTTPEKALEWGRSYGVEHVYFVRSSRTAYLPVDEITIARKPANA